MKEGSFVRHRGQPAWGVGRVLEISGGNIRVQFTARLITLKAAVAGPHLEELTKTEIANLGAQPAPIRPTTRARAGRVTPCLTCAEPLTRSQRRQDDLWKSCSECSVNDGREHVFHPYPKDFEETDARASEHDPSGAQSLCLACRKQGTVSGTRKCSQLPA